MWCVIKDNLYNLDLVCSIDTIPHSPDGHVLRLFLDNGEPIGIQYDTVEELEKAFDKLSQRLTTK